MAASADELMGLLEHWLPQQRWFPAKGSVVTVSVAAVLPGVSRPERHSEVRVLRLAYPDAQGTPVVTLLQVPLLFLKVTDQAPDDGAALPGDAGLIGAVSSAGGEDGSPAVPGPWHVYDAPQRREYLDEVLASTSLNAHSENPGERAGIQARRGPDAAKSIALSDPLFSMEPMRSEQSNTSIVLNALGRGMIVKFFRTLSAGQNPEVELGAVLTRLGTQDVPATLGWLEAHWQDQGVAYQADLAVIHEFLPGGSDAWGAALDAAARGESFARQAHAIGQGTARIHRRLAEGLPVSTAPEGVLSRLAARVRDSWAQVRAVVGPYDAEIEALLTSLSAVPAQPQRIHGDLHLGQILTVQSPSAGAERWIFLDFEGEPLRPISERALPDLPLRDVVGLLRSLDYAAGAAQRQVPGAEVSDGWVAECSAAFLEGYSSVVPGRIDQRSPLFMALWLDKALYEVRYEQSNRPGWLDIPVSAARATLDELAGPDAKGKP
ncbi:maltokinase N-terminal cap-like domain-containing protein [Arthrobacter woluwensis]|uniref:maltokinase N-terminal cap-like domain-containing protein n=1 Tax=Arthrobacter woluwensis TaxID=156980 RepID=UPI0026C8A267